MQRLWIGLLTTLQQKFSEPFDIIDFEVKLLFGRELSL